MDKEKIITSDLNSPRSSWPWNPDNINLDQDGTVSLNFKDSAQYATLSRPETRVTTPLGKAYFDMILTFVSSPYWWDLNVYRYWSYNADQREIAMLSIVRK